MLNLFPKKYNEQPFFPKTGPKVIAFLAHKGGVGKTTLSLNLGYGLARKGHMTLIMDFDSQNDTGVFFNTHTLVDERPTMIDVLNENATPQEAVFKARENLYLIQSSRALSRFGKDGGNGSGLTLKKLMQKHADFFNLFEYIIIDTMPSHSILHLNILLVTHAVFVPLGMSAFGVNGVAQVKETIDEINEDIREVKSENPNLDYSEVKIARIIPNQLDRRMKTRTDKILDTIKDAYPGKLFPIPIRTSTALLDAEDKHLFVQEFAPHSTAAEDYDLFAEEVLRLE